MNAAFLPRPRRIGVVAAVLAVATVILIAPLNAADAESDISISFDELILGEPGSQTRVADYPVDEALVGLTCDLSVDVANQASVHMGNDLVVTTGTEKAVLRGIEDTENGATNQTHRLKLGNTITADLRFGNDGTSSLGFTLSFECIRPRVLDTPTLERELPTAPPAAAIAESPTYTG